MAFQTNKNTGVLIKKASRLFERVANKNLEQLGVTYAQTTFLIRLLEKDGQTQQELYLSSGVKQPTVVRTLDRMERDGLITRTRSTTDRRAIHFYLTSKAKKICQKLKGEATEMHEIAVENLNRSQVETLNNLLEKVINNLQGKI